MFKYLIEYEYMYKNDTNSKIGNGYGETIIELDFEIKTESDLRKAQYILESERPLYYYYKVTITEYELLEKSKKKG